MKKLLSLIFVLFFIFYFTGCSKVSEVAIYQLTNQSYSQMMSYIIECDGTTIVIDGGTSDDEEHLIEKIKSISKDNKVEAWFLTHYHKDHTGALAKYLQSGDQSLGIDNIYYNFPKKSWVKNYEENRYQDLVDIDSGLKKYDNKNIVYLNEKIKVDDVSIKVLRTYNENITENAGNNSSSVYKFNVLGTKILFLGDLGVEGGEELLVLNKDAIENMDYVQMAHHGQQAVNEDVYDVINPKYCLWPTTDWLWSNTDGTYKTAETKAWMKKLNVKKNYVANKEDIRIVLKKE